MGVGNAELPIDGHALEDVALPFSDVELGGDLGVAFHDGLVVLDSEIQQILDARRVGNDVEQYRPPLFGRQVSHFPVDDQGGMEKVSDDGLQDDIAIGAVNDGGVVGVKGEGMASDVQAEIRNIGDALDVQKIKRAPKSTG